MYDFNFILAWIWLVIGIWLIVANRMAPLDGTTVIQIGDARVSLLGCVALVLSAYNVVRWWVRFSMRRAKKKQEEMLRRDEQAERERLFRESGQTPDPNFNFDKPPGDAGA